MMVVFKLNAVHKNSLRMTMHLMSFNLNHFRRRKQGLFSIINSFHIERRNCQLPLAGVACNQHSEKVRSLG